MSESRQIFIVPLLAKHCDKETELTHISKDGFVNRFGFFLSKEDPFKPGQQDIDIESGWFRRQTVLDYKRWWRNPLAMITASMMNLKILIDHYKKKESLVRGFSFWAKKYP